MLISFRRSLPIVGYFIVFFSICGNSIRRLRRQFGTIIRKCKRAVTDSEAQVLYREEQPGVHNLIDIYCACTDKTPDEVVKEFDGRGYGDFKTAVGEQIVSVLKPLQARVKELEADRGYIDSIIKNNAEKANYTAQKTLRKVQKKVGFPEKIR